MEEFLVSIPKRELLLRKEVYRCMSGIANSVWIFNEAYRRAWEALVSDSERPTSNDMAVRLRDNIQVLMKAGRDDPEEIATLIVERLK